MTVITIPLNTGCHEEVDQRLMTDGRLRTVRNGRLDREGRIRVRAGYTALSMLLDASPGIGTCIPYDIGSYNGRLIVLGDNSDDDVGYATDLYEYTGLTAIPWRPTFHWFTSPAGRRLPYATNLRDLPIVGDIAGGCSNAGCAALNGHVALAYDMFGASAAESRAFARVMLASTGQLLVSDNLDIGAGSTHFPINPQCAATPTKLVVTVVDFGSSGGGTFRKLFAYTYTPGTSVGFTQQATPLLTDVALDLGAYGMAAISGGTGIVVAALQGLTTGTVKVRQYDSNMVVVVPSGGQYADIVLAGDPSSIAVEADVTQNTLTVAAVQNNDLFLYVYNLSTGAALGTPPDGATIQGLDNVFSHSNALALTRYDATTVLVSYMGEPTTAPLSTYTVGWGLFNPATQAETAGDIATELRDSAPVSKPLIHDGEIVHAVARGSPLVATDVVLMATVFDQTLFQGWHVPLAAPDQGFSQPIPPGFRSDLCRDAGTGKVYWLRGALNEQEQVTPVVTEMDLGSTDRRQMVELAGALYIAGGVVLRYDGTHLSEQGWLERPRIISATPSNSTGTLDNSATYTYVVTWETTDAQLNVDRSPVSAPTTVTMGAAEDTVTLVASVPLSMRLNTKNSMAVAGLGVRVVFWRNTSEVVSGTPTPSATLQRAGHVDIDSTNFPGATVSFVDTVPDATLVSREVLYTQIESPLDNHASQPAKYLSAASDALMSSGLPNRNRWNISKPLQPFEGIAYAQNGILAFEGRVARGEIEQALGFQQSWLLATQKELWLLNGQGPDIRGIGEFQRTYRIPSDGGMRAEGWRSVVEFGKGVMYQLQDDQLYLWAGGQPVPVGLEIQDTLLEFPNVVAACHVTGAQAVALALQNDAGSDGCIVLWDQQSNQWFRDDVGAVDGLAEHDGRLAYLQGGVVYLEDADYGTGTAPTLRIDTGNVAKTGVAGASGVQQIILTGVYQGDFMAELLIKYTDDQTFSSLGEIEFLSSDGYAAGDPLDQEWRPTRDDTSRFELQLLVSGVGSNTKQGWLNALEVHYDVDEGPKRVPDARRR